MARSKFSKKLNNIVKIIDGVEVRVKDIAERAKNIAIDTLSNAEYDNMDFTQKHGGVALANEIQLIENKEGSYTIVAGATAPPEIKYEFYFAEYGAGIDATHSLVGSGYQEVGGNRYTLGEDARFHKDVNGEYWWYPSENIGDKVGRKFGQFTNTSTPIHYMEEARRWAKEQFGTTAKEIRTAIRRAKG